MENSQGQYSTDYTKVQQEIRVDPEFEEKIPKIGEEEFALLRENILAAGEVYEALVVWNGTLVDGHNRWKIIQENPEIKYRVRQMDFPDKWAAFEWMYKNQLGRRNLTDEQRSYAIGKMYESRKKSVGNATSQRNADGTFQCTQNGNIGQTPTRVSNQIADELGIGKGTVLRANQFMRGVDIIREVSPEAAEKVLAGKAKVSKTYVQQISQLEPEKVDVAVDTILNGMKPQPKPAKPRPRKTDEDRKDLKEIEAIVADMCDPTTTPAFTIDMLIEDIELNGQTYVELLANTLTDRSNLVTDENKPRIAAAIDKVVENILKVRESI